MNVGILAKHLGAVSCTWLSVNVATFFNKRKAIKPTREGLWRGRQGQMLRSFPQSTCQKKTKIISENVVERTRRQTQQQHSSNSQPSPYKVP